MSWYYSYYLGYQKDGKLYPLGPYDAQGKLHNVFNRSRSFASDLHEEFAQVPDSMVSEELRKEFESESWSGEKTVDLWYLPAAELGSSNFIKTGYFLMADVTQYQESKSAEDLFYDRLTPEVYAAKLLAEAKLGRPPKPQDDDEDYCEEHNASEYMFFAYPDYRSQEYETSLLQNALESMEFATALKEGKAVILMTQG